MVNRESLEKGFNARRNDLLVISILSLVNVLLAVLIGSEESIAFSALLPLMMVSTGNFLTKEFNDELYTVGFAVIAVLMIAFYFLCWILSKKTRGMILGALIMFSLDTAMLLFAIATDMLEQGFHFYISLTGLFHIWALSSLISGTSAWAKLKPSTKSGGKYAKS